MRIILMVFSIFLLTLNCFSQVDTFSDKYVDSIGWPDIDIIGGNDASYALKTPIPAGVDVMLSTFCNRNSISCLQQPLDIPTYHRLLIHQR